MEPVKLIHCASVKPGPRVAACGAKDAGECVVPIAKSTCVECWKHFYGEHDGPRYFAEHMASGSPLERS